MILSEKERLFTVMNARLECITQEVNKYIGQKHGEAPNLEEVAIHLIKLKNELVCLEEL